MDILEFINGNGVLCSGIFGLFTTIVSILATALVRNAIEKKKAQKDTVAKLQKELHEVKKELEKYTSIEAQEQTIDKTTGSIYVETLPNGTKRNICGYCWENHHTKMPLIMGSYDSEEEHRKVTYGNCGSCKATCYDG